MKNRIYDEPSRLPVNKAAGRVLGGGFNYEPNKKIVQQHWSAPPKIVPAPRNFEDLTGRKFGRFTVIGYLPSTNTSKGSLWLVRCVCGDYESRRTRSVRNPKNNNDCCENCRHLIHLKRTDEFLRTGKHKDDPA